MFMTKNNTISFIFINSSLQKYENDNNILYIPYILYRTRKITRKIKIAINKES